jgi:hypothetical protein
MWYEREENRAGTIIKLNFIEIVQCFHILFNYAVLVFKMKKKNKKKI